MLDGMVFYRSKNEVILTQGLDGWLPVKYFIKAVKINYSTCDIEELEFDRGVSMPSWAAELAPSGPGEAGSYMVKNLEALIANCRKRMAEINELKACNILPFNPYFLKNSRKLISMAPFTLSCSR
ncbi:2'-phosphotransferase [Durusdinium trenchii]|uniref:2'-phosphotransferase n=1 Tax=Durusdinium trenchii TaxID=1381693 RepID=A0ABP0MV29_9DINO